MSQRGENEKAIQWLQLAGRQDMVDQWEALEASWRKRGVKTRRSFWDILAGMYHKKPAEEYEVVHSGTEEFKFDIFAEACHRRGRTPPKKAIVTGVDK